MTSRPESAALLRTMMRETPKGDVAEIVEMICDTIPVLNRRGHRSEMVERDVDHLAWGRMLDQMESGIILGMLPDGGRSYLSTFLDDKWMEEHRFL
ncbi:hypothetical protein J4439_04540 [Candidatus Woesearchaeota archaeon]|nr:hypothetical protein [Candidatus Woesearchaeota archaeon]